MKSEPDSTMPKQHINFPIIAIGASEDGGTALETIFQNLPARLQAAIILMEPFAANAKSQPLQTLQIKFSSTAFAEISNNLPLETGKIYVNRPGQEVTMKAGAFCVKRFHKTNEQRPIDILFTSLAENVPEKMVAVVLSGKGTDGTRGLRDVKCKGGMVLVQDPATAEYAEMPQSAIDAGNIDYVLSPKELGNRIVSLVKNLDDLESCAGPLQQDEFNVLFQFLREKAGHVFESYKSTVLTRRIQRRMSLLGVSDVGNYHALLQNDPVEMSLLASDLMIGVTGFFRDSGSWESLRKNVIEHLTLDKKTNTPIRVWTPGCSTGEEAYTIAMMLLYATEQAGRRRDITVFATDVNENALLIAREGSYPASAMADVPQQYLKAYFTTADDGHAHINKHVRDHVVFAKQNVLLDPPFSKLDLLICRNLLIYFEQVSQDKCISIFHYALKENGCLFLGNAESLGHRKGYFKQFADKSSRIYQRVTQAKPFRYSFSVATGQLKKPTGHATAPNQDTTMIEFAHETLLSLYAPASVLINHCFDIVYFNGPVKRFIEPPAGQSSFDFISWIPQNMRSRVRGTLLNISPLNRDVAVTINLPDQNGNNDRLATLNCTHCTSPIDNSDMYLIVFTDNTTQLKTDPPQYPRTRTDGAAVQQLERELMAMRDELQTNVEELKSANEELQSSNEELQASNEEMETSREELQSLNEELVTVNGQLELKIAEHETTNNDLINFVSSSNIPTLFLDHDFNVRRFSPAMTQLVKLIPTDIGRPISDMSIVQLGEELLADAQSVLNRLSPVNREVAMGDSWFMRATHPYRTSDNRIEGVVITFVDTTVRKRTEQRLAFKSLILANVHDAAIGLDMDYTINYWNESARVMYGWTEHEAHGKKSFDLLDTEYMDTTVADVVAKIKETGRTQFEALHRTKDGKRLSVEVHSALVKDPQGNPIGFISTSRDLTERKRLEEEINNLAKFPSENPNPILRLDAKNGVVLTANRSSERLLRMWNTRVGDQVPADIVQKVTETFTNRQRSALELDCENRCYSFDMVPVTDTGYVNLYGQDVTDRKQAEAQREAAIESLRESQRRLNAVFNGVSETILMMDIDGNILEANETGARRWGFSVSELVGKNMYSFLPPDKQKERAAQIKDIIASGQPVRFEDIREDTVFDLTFYPIIEANDTVSKFVVYGQDITKRKKIESEMKIALDTLRENERRSNAILNAASESIWLMTIQGDILAANETAAKRMGKNVSDVVGKNCFDLLYPEIGKQRKSKIEEMVRTRSIVRFEDIRNGITFDHTFYPVRNDNGEITGLAIFSSDVTERKKMELEKQQTLEALRESEQRFRAISTNTPDHILMQDKDLRYVFVVNPQLGLTEEDMLGKTDYDILAKDDADKITKTKKQVISTNTSLHLEIPLLDREGKQQFFNGSYIPKCNEQGQVDGLIGYFKNVTSNKLAEETIRKSEQRLKFHFENSPLAVVEWNADFIVTQWSNEAERIFGWKKEDTLGKCIDTLNMIHTEDMPIVNNTMERLTSGKERMVVSKNRNYTKLGKVIDCAWYNSVLLDQNGKMESVMSLVQDITEQKRSQEEIKQRAEELRTINEELTRFNRAMVNRELRMIELKKEVNTLDEQAGRQPRYNLDFMDR